MNETLTEKDNLRTELEKAQNEIGVLNELLDIAHKKNQSLFAELNELKAQSSDSLRAYAH